MIRPLPTRRPLPWTLIVLAVVCLFGAPSVVAEEPEIRAVWLNQDQDGHIEIAPCGDSLCGTIVWLKDPLDAQGRPELDDENPDPAKQNQPILGLQILEGFPLEADRKGLWADGTIYDPNNGKTYSCQMSFKDPDTLKIRGYIGISLLGRTEIWTRVAPADADLARRALEQRLGGDGGG